jgi:predicted CXXCH cytochrome family protein
MNYVTPRMAGMLLAGMGIVAGSSAVFAQSLVEAVPELPDDYSCMLCHHQDGDLWNESTPVADETHLQDDIHWKRGLLCHDCHGGSPTLDEFKNHRNDPDFRSVASPADVPEFCGHCHSQLDYMRRYNPSSRTDQVAEYWTSGHGQRLKEWAAASADEADTDAEDAVAGAGEVKVATCVDCHGGHGIREVKDTNSLVYPTHVAETCARCHSDAQLMPSHLHDGRPLGHHQFEEWQQSVHGVAMLEKGDLSAASCNDCHGNHGATPPGVDFVANACGTCHGKVARLFAETQMKHKFEEARLPGCATCHGNHKIVHPTDDMLGMASNSVCVKCHNAEQLEHGATTAGADVARYMRQRLDQLKADITAAEHKVEMAERLGMEVSGPRYDLRSAFDALTNARTQVHSFKPEPLDAALEEGLQVTASVNALAEDALREHTRRRVWLAATLLPILIVVGLLLLYIRAFPATGGEAPD